MLFALEGRGFEVLTFDLPRTTLIELAVYKKDEYIILAYTKKLVKLQSFVAKCCKILKL
jgi:hypothetical protein